MSTTETYDRIAALHYAAYRPPLHALILRRLIPPGERFRLGLDVGCGTGYSAIALAPFCDRVIGLDPSPEMLASASSHPNVEYRQGNGERLLELPMAQCGIVTFAGSLYYAKSEALRRELLRTCPDECVILCYDFDVLTRDILTELGVAMEVVNSGYDHRVNCSDWDGFIEQTVGTERLQLAISVQEIAHVLLADSNHYRALSKRYGCEDPFERVVAELCRGGRTPSLSADLFFARYHVGKGQGA